MISNLTIIAIALNIVIAMALLAVFFVRYRKVEFFTQSFLWGILISVLSNVIINLVGVTLFRDGFTGLGPVAASLANALLMTLAIGSSYVIVSGFQFKKGRSSKSPVVNALAFSIISIMNVIMQSLNFFMYAFAINRGTVEQFISESFTQEALDGLIKVFNESSPLLFLELGFNRIFEIGVIIVAFTLLYKSLKSEGGFNLKNVGLGFGVLFIYFAVYSLTSLLGLGIVLALVIRAALSIGIVFFFKDQLDI